jgi:NAD(P) transhydrogenase subunit beta
VSAFDTITRLLFLVAATGFVVGLHQMNHPATARRGNRLSAAAMALAVATTVALLVREHLITTTALVVLVVGLAGGGIAGLVTARRVKMTAMPQLVSFFNAVGGGAAALIAFAEAIAHRGAVAPADQATYATLATTLGVLIGTITFGGSLVASGKLAGLVPGRPLGFPGLRQVELLLAVVAVVAGAVYTTGNGNATTLAVLAAAGLALGTIATLPIGGADMPVVVSLLNACTGTAVAMAGFVISSTPLIIAGALVGAAGGILTKLMADAMNRSLVSIVAGGFGTGDEQQGGPAGPTGGTVRTVTADDAALQLAYAGTVVIVPGYGLAAAQAQHEMVELVGALTEHGVNVNYGIHPVAGRMPGQMNVLLAEANAPYPQLKDLDEINPRFPGADIVLVVGANDVTNPAARRPGNAVSGMPILDVDRAKNVIVIKRSLGHGYAGIDNELYTNPKTQMLFGDAKTVLAGLLENLHSYTR